MTFVMTFVRHLSSLFVTYLSTLMTFRDVVESGLTKSGLLLNLLHGPRVVPNSVVQCCVYKYFSYRCSGVSAGVYCLTHGRGAGFSPGSLLLSAGAAVLRVL